jgi:inner membrane protein
MDNITHTLIGAVIGQAGLKRRTGLAMPALMIAANIPDVDAPCVVYGVESLAMRRGITHGPIALIVLPLVLAGLLIAYDRWQERRGTRPAGRAAVRPGWLIGLCYLGALTHPAFDWLNNYGIRLLEPFSSRWFYGDALFIIDPWMMAALGLGIWLSRRREKAQAANWTRPAMVAVAAVLAYVGFNIGFSRAVSAAALSDAPYPRVAVAKAVPLAFWRREILWRGEGGTWGSYECILLECRRYPLVVRRTGMDDPRIALWASADPAARAFLFWSRMPIAEPGPKGILLKDQRFLERGAQSNFSVLVNPPE